MRRGVISGLERLTCLDEVNRMHGRDRPAIRPPAIPGLEPKNFIFKTST
jgi:hypothetical protein